MKGKTEQTITAIVAIVQAMNATTTIQVKTKTRDDLRSIGSMGEDYNSVIERLIREHNHNNLVKYSRQVAEERKDEFVSIDEL